VLNDAVQWDGRGRAEFTAKDQANILEGLDGILLAAGRNWASMTKIIATISASVSYGAIGHADTQGGYQNVRRGVGGREEESCVSLRYPRRSKMSPEMNCGANERHGLERDRQAYPKERVRLNECSEKVQSGWKVQYLHGRLRSHCRAFSPQSSIAIYHRSLFGLRRSGGVWRHGRVRYFGSRSGTYSSVELLKRVKVANRFSRTGGLTLQNPRHLRHQALDAISGFQPTWVTHVPKATWDSMPKEALC